MSGYGLTPCSARGPCLQTPTCKLVEMMEQLKTTRFIVNSGTPACYTISKRQPEG
jgi:hypothetical protein